MKKIILVFGILLLSAILVLANANNNEIEEGKKLVESSISCDKLTDEQLEAIGEYYMEQMHPRESHELMHKMMGLKEGSEDEEQFHINMAKTMYCNEDENMGMMGGGMMNMMGGNMMNNIGSYGMMSNPFGYGYWSFWSIVWQLFWIAAIVLIIWLIYKFVIKREGISKTPIEILKKRYASGEITKKQFEEIKKKIS